LKKSYPLFFCISLLILIGVVFFTPFHTQDGPNHKKGTLILSRLDSSPLEAKVYESGLGPFNTNTLFSLLYLPFKKFLSIDTYEKCFVSFFLISLLFFYRVFLSAWSVENDDLWPLILPVLFHPLYLRGFYNFLASVSITLIALTLVQKGMQKKNWKYVFFFLLICWVGQLAHPFTFIILSITLGTQGFVAWRNDWKNLFPYIAIVLFFLCLGFVLPLFGTGIGSQTPYTFNDIPAALGGLLHFNFMGYSVFNLLVPLPFLLILAVLTFKNLRTQGFSKNALWLMALFFYIIFPRGGGGSAHANERFLPYIFLFLPLSLGGLAVLWRKRIVYFAFLTFLMVSAGVSWGMFQLSPGIQDAKKVLSQLPPVSRLYPISFDLKGHALLNWNMAHVWADYENDRVVFSPYLFALPKLMPLRKPLLNEENYFPATLEDYPSNAFVQKCGKGWLFDTPPCGLWREQAMATIFQSAQYYDYWLVNSPTEDFWRNLQSIPHLKLVAQSGDFSLWHYEAPLSFHPSVP